MSDGVVLRPEVPLREPEPEGRVLALVGASGRGRGD